MPSTHAQGEADVTFTQAQRPGSRARQGAAHGGTDITGAEIDSQLGTPPAMCMQPCAYRRAGDASIFVSCDAHQTADLGRWARWQGWARWRHAAGNAFAVSGLGFRAGPSTAGEAVARIAIRLGREGAARAEREILI
eukprot:6564244-Prymnesium_polylepis.1